MNAYNTVQHPSIPVRQLLKPLVVIKNEESELIMTTVREQVPSKPKKRVVLFKDEPDEKSARK